MTLVLVLAAWLVLSVLAAFAVAVGLRLREHPPVAPVEPSPELVSSGSPLISGDGVGPVAAGH